jgi:hypothetical protein
MTDKGEDIAIGGDNGASRSHTLLPCAERAGEVAGALFVGADAADGEGYIVVDCVPIVRAREVQLDEHWNAASMAKWREHKKCSALLSATPSVTSKSQCHPITSLPLISMDCLSLAPPEERHDWGHLSPWLWPA